MPTFSMRPRGERYGYYPQWTWREPPGIGRAEQWAYSVYSLAPLSPVPGDVPLDYIRIFDPPTWTPMALRWQGMPVTHDDPRLTQLGPPPARGVEAPYQVTYPWYMQPPGA